MSGMARPYPKDRYDRAGECWHPDGWKSLEEFDALSHAKDQSLRPQSAPTLPATASCDGVARIYDKMMASEATGAGVIQALLRR